MNGMDWDVIERRLARIQRAPRVYQSRVCVRCGRSISEGAYSGRDGNFKKHSKACARKHGCESEYQR